MAQASYFVDLNIKEVNATSTHSGKVFDMPTTSTATSSNPKAVPNKDEPTNIPVKVSFP